MRFNGYFPSNKRCDFAHFKPVCIGFDLVECRTKRSKQFLLRLFAKPLDTFETLLDGVQVGNDALLFGKRWQWYANL